MNTTYPKHLNHQNLLTAKRFFWTALCVTFVLKLYLAHIVPITGDEAEYVYWGQHLSWGYYDHPPMIAWILHFISTISLSNIWLRMPQILVSSIIGCCIYTSLGSFDHEKAYLVAALYLLSPVSIFAQGILTDTPLMLFSFLAINSLFLAVKNDKTHHYVLSGLFIGAAFFSKYLMFPIALGMLLFFVFSLSDKNKWRNFFLLIIFSLPFVIQNLTWNYSHDWVNLLFNLDLRNVHDKFELRKPLLYVVSTIYLYSPLVFYYSVKNLKPFYLLLKTKSPFNIFIISAFTTILFYAALSILKRIGLHWTFAAYPFLFMSLFAVLNARKIKKCLHFMLFYCLIQFIAVVILFSIPLSFWKKTSYFHTVNWFLNYQKVVPSIKPYLDKGFVLATPSYAQSYLLAYKGKFPAAVWGVGSVHGRQDDLSTDFKKLNHKNFIIVDIREKITTGNIKPYFKKFAIKYDSLFGMPYRVILGYDFDYSAYRKIILKGIYDKYYQIPSFFPRSLEFYKAKYNL